MEFEKTAQRDDGIRQLVDLAFRYGRSKQSKQTGYVHYYQHAEPGDKHDPIPVVENTLFVLALFQTRTSENIVEGKTLLDCLLHFQNQNGPFYKGNFPLYLHEYPNCKDRFLGAQLLPPFYWILKHFHQVLGNDLKQKLEKASASLVEHCLTMQKDKPGPCHIAIKIAAGAIALGQWLQRTDFEKEGRAILEQLHGTKEPSSWFSPSHIADMLAALQMVYPSLSESRWSDFWEHLAHTWHNPTGCYIGPPIREHQTGLEPQATLYDLYLGYFSGTFSKRALAEHPFHLHAALIQPSLDRLASPSYPFIKEGMLDDRRWHLQQQEKHAYCTIERKAGLNPVFEKGLHALRLVWGNRDRAHSFVCQGEQSSTTTYEIRPDGLDLSFALEAREPITDRDEGFEIGFYMDAQENARFSVAGVPANTFKLDDEITIMAAGGKMTLGFTLEKGSGQFFGHIMRGNRPAQITAKGSHRFDAYDWKIFLRSVRRAEPCIIKAALSFGTS